MASTTLLEQMKQTENPQKLFIMKELAVSEMFQVVPLKNVDGGGEFFDREDELPDVDFRGVNEAQDDSTGTLDPQSSALKLFGGDVKTDVGKIDMYGPGHHRTQVEMKTRAMRMKWEDVFINGDADANPRQFNGLRKLMTIGSSQVINNHASAGPLSKSALDEMLDAVQPGAQKYLIMSKAMRRIITNLSVSPTLAGNINYEKDDFGIQRARYGEAVIVCPDVNNQKGQIIDFNEANSTTSIYCVTFGDTLFSGIQGRVRGEYGLGVYDLGESHVAPYNLTRIRWHLAATLYHSRAAARLRNITNAAAIA
jgi:hypothetical protein